MFPLEKSIEEQLREFTGPLPTIIFPEADDPRVIAAASRLVQFAKVVLVRRKADLARDLDELDIPLKVSKRRFNQTVRCIHPDETPKLCEEFAAALQEKSKGRSWEVDIEKARELVKDPVYFAIMSVRLGYADAVLGGVTHSSRDFFKPCLRLLERSGTVYEMGLFALPDAHDGGFFKENLVMFADVALNEEPSPERLADIAVGACKTMRDVIPEDVLPEVNAALLSYSTRGSGAGPSVERIRGAEPIIKGRLEALAKDDPRYASINIAAELQVSCAISKQLARTKLGQRADDNPAVGNSNVLIAPSLDTGNLLFHMYSTSYPDAQSVLIIGGLQNQALDFSRSSTVDDIAMGAKALILRMFKSGRYTRTPRDLFFPRFKILTVSPHREHTEIALWEGRDLNSREHLIHDPADLPQRLLDQIPVRLRAVKGFLERHGIEEDELEAVVSRGGLVLPVESGAYRVDDRMLADLTNEVSGRHVINLGTFLINEIGKECPNVFIIDPAVVDELDEVSRITGLKGTEQEAAWHALGQKAAAKRYAVSHGKEYENLNLIVAFLGAGISIGAHRDGRCVKVKNSLFDGPMGPDRAGALPGGDLIELCFSGLTKEQVVERLTQDGGVKSYVGTANVFEVERRAMEGDRDAKLVLDAMLEQIAAEIASLVPKFNGEPVHQIILTGSMTQSKRMVNQVRGALSLLPIGVTVYPGNLELEALRDGALRVLNDFEALKEYTPLRSTF